MGVCTECALSTHDRTQTAKLRLKICHAIVIHHGEPHNKCCVPYHCSGNHFVMWWRRQPRDLCDSNQCVGFMNCPLCSKMVSLTTATSVEKTTVQSASDHCISFFIPMRPARHLLQTCPVKNKKDLKKIVGNFLSLFVICFSPSPSLFLLQIAT